MSGMREMLQMLREARGDIDVPTGYCHIPLLVLINKVMSKSRQLSNFLGIMLAVLDEEGVSMQLTEDWKEGSSAAEAGRETSIGVDSSLDRNEHIHGCIAMWRQPLLDTQRYLQQDH